MSAEVNASRVCGSSHAASRRAVSALKLTTESPDMLMISSCRVPPSNTPCTSRIGGYPGGQLPALIMSATSPILTVLGLLSFGCCNIDSSMMNYK